MNPIKRMIGGRPYPKDLDRACRVKVELAKRNMSISDLAYHLSVPQSNLSDVINGRRRSPKTESRIAAYFGLPREDLFPPRTPGELLAMRKQEQGAA